MTPTAWIIIGTIALAVGLVLWLPMRKRWNDDGADDERRELP